MKLQQTLAIIKPGAVRQGHTRAIIQQIQANTFTIKNRLDTHLTLDQAQAFYAVHSHRPFYQELCTYMSSGPVVVLVLEKGDAVEAFRKLIGATNPKEAAPGTLRHQFGTTIDDNAVHGSDAAHTAQEEVKFFFTR